MTMSPSEVRKIATLYFFEATLSGSTRSTSEGTNGVGPVLGAALRLLGGGPSAGGSTFINCISAAVAADGGVGPTSGSGAGPGACAAPGADAPGIVAAVPVGGAGIEGMLPAGTPGRLVGGGDCAEAECIPNAAAPIKRSTVMKRKK
jgi:hypothetical protein